MKYFTPDWHGFGKAGVALSEEEERAVVATYEQHVARLLPSIPPEIHGIVQGKISLHDGLVLDARLDGAAKELRILLRCGDFEGGSFDLELRYGAIRPPRPASAQLKELMSLNAVALYDEFDRDDEGLLVHRILFWIGRDRPSGPYRELEMVFETLRITQTPRATPED